MSALVLGLSACATTPPRPPLKAEIRNSTKAAVAERIAGLCQEYGFDVEDIRESAVDCSRFGGTSAQVMLGTKYGSDVESKLRFTLLNPSPDVVRVTPQEWFYRQNAFGGEKKTPASPEHNADVISLFRDLNEWGAAQ